LLEVQGISLAETPNFTYGVYLNLPEGEVSAEQARLHYVGAIDFFGKAPGAGHAHAEVKPFDATFDAGDAIARLQRRGRWDVDKLTVTLRPLTPVPPRGQEEAVRTRSEESAKRAKITYKRINLTLAP
jgi:hypothetical protein